MGRRSKASPSRGGGSAKPGRRGRAGKRQPLSRLRRQLPCKGEPLVRRILVPSPMMRINSRNRKKMTKGARREIVRCEQTDRTLLRDLPSQ